MGHPLRWVVALTALSCGGSTAVTTSTETSDTSAAESGPCPATISIPSAGEQVGQQIQLQVSFPASCASSVDAMIAYIDTQRCDESPYAFPNAGCRVTSNQFSTSTWVQVAPGTHTLNVNSWQGPTVSTSTPITFTYTPSGNNPCPATITVPSQNEQVGQSIQLQVSFKSGCTPDTMTASIDGQRCDQSPYPYPNAGCTVNADQFSGSTWVQVTPGTHTLSVDSWQGSTESESTPITFTYATSSTGDPVLAGAGDIGWYAGKSFEIATGHEVEAINPDLVFTLGDNAYGANGNDQGAIQNYDGCYDPAWGAFKAKTLPMPGNHDYGNWDSQAAGQARVMSGYYPYFTGGDPNSPTRGITVGGNTWDTLHYGYDLTTASGKKWRYIALNSGPCFYKPYTTQNCGTSSSEYAWLQNELATHLKTRSGGSYVGIIVGTHFNRWSSGGCGGGNGQVDPFVQLMYDYHVDLYLAGHIHDYERFCQIGKTAQSTSQGNCGAVTGPVCDTAGPVEINVGTGGADDGTEAMPDAWAASQKRITQTGVLKLVLHDTSWDFEFRSTADQVLDSNSYAVH
jgi:hypothetical protein